MSAGIGSLSLYDSVYETWKAAGDWPDQLIQHISSQYSYRVGGNDQPLRSMLDLTKKNGCQTVVIERDYYDEDYLDEYVAFYCRTFDPHSQRCLRLHFFTAALEARDLRDLQDKSESYLGYTVVRPTHAFVSGRSALVPDRNPPNETYILSRATFPVNLAGNPLQVVAAPFTQQDINVGACAQSALWMMALYMHRAYGYTRFHPAEISRAATQYLATSGGRDGLNLDHVKEGIRSMGFTPHSCSAVVDPNVGPIALNQRELSKFIYAFVESELPVLLAYVTQSGGHAVAAVGHTYQLTPAQHLLPSAGPAQSFVFGADQIEYRTASEWVGAFVVNNDAEGPYRPFPNDAPTLQHLMGAFATAPAEINLTPQDAEYRFQAFIPRVNDLFDPNDHFSKADFSDLVIRPYLIRSNKYKAALKSRPLHDVIKRIYRSAPMPKFLWVIELSRPNLISQADPSKRQMLGEFLIDATGNPFDHDVAVLGFHFLGRVFFRHTQKITVTIPGDGPYPHSVRAPGSVP